MLGFPSNVGSIKCNGNSLANGSFKGQQIVCISAGNLLGGVCLVWSDNPLPLLGGRAWLFLSLVGLFLVPSHLAVVSKEHVFVEVRGVLYMPLPELE